MNKKLIKVYQLLLLLAIFQIAAFAQPAKKVLTLEDYGKWNRISATAISPDAKWVSFAYNSNAGADTLYIKSNSGDKIYKIPNGSAPIFSNDTKWVSYIVGLPKAEREKLAKDKKPVTRKSELLNLASGEKTVFENVSNAKFSDNSKYLTISKPKTKSNGFDVIVKYLEDGSTVNFGNIGLFDFNKNGTHLAYVVDAENKAGNGVYIFELSTSVIKKLDTGEAEYSLLTWNETGTGIALLKGNEEKDLTRKVNKLVFVKDLDKSKNSSVTIDTKDISNFPKDFVISELGRITWSKDNSKILFGIKEQSKKEKPESDEVANVDVWHWKDEAIQAEQMVTANRDKNFTYLSVYNTDTKKFFQLNDEKNKSVSTSKNGKWGIVRDTKPYLLRLDLSEGKADYYSINLESGETKLIEKMLGVTLGISEGGKYFIYMKEKELYAYDFSNDKKTHLTNGKPGFFVNEEDDHMYDEKPAYRISGWEKDDKSFIIGHKFDIYQVFPETNKFVNITMGFGEKEEIRFTYNRINPEEETIDFSKPLYLSAYGEWTKFSGYYKLKLGTAPEKLIYADKRFGRIVKAKNSDDVIFTQESFVDFPDYYLSQLNFKEVKKITDANPQQQNYAWGKRVLVDFKNNQGVKLQATLTLPANYDKNKKYPMIVYFYEKVSQNHNQYAMPVYDDRPHASTYASDGYLFLMPDIVYSNGTPGTNAYDCIIPAVNKVIELGYADPKKIGLQGHSWGGYQSSYLVTQTDMFACVVTGAPLTSLVSMYNILYKGSGTTNQPQIEFGQGRMGKTPWEDMATYISQSPVHQATKIKTPFMILHGTVDGSVDWNQGLEYYTAARRLGKEVILLSYPGEDHHLNKLENQKDFQIRMKQYFDHYLKGAEAPKWMIEGVPFLDKKFKGK